MRRRGLYSTPKIVQRRSRETADGERSSGSCESHLTSLCRRRPEKLQKANIFLHPLLVRHGATQERRPRWVTRKPGFHTAADAAILRLPPGDRNKGAIKPHDPIERLSSHAAAEAFLGNDLSGQF